MNQPLCLSIVHHVSTVQWGNGSNTTAINFPIAFTQFVKVQATCYAAEWAWVSDVRLNSFRLRADAAGFWLAIGI